MKNKIQSFARKHKAAFKIVSFFIQCLTGGIIGFGLIIGLILDSPRVYLCAIAGFIIFVILEIKSISI